MVRLKAKGKGLPAVLLALSALASAGVSANEELPLLDQQTIRSPLAAGCEGQPDSTPIPLDPRTLVVPGVNNPDSAVQFNAFWVDLHNPPEPFIQDPQKLPPNPTTCGEFRASVARGKYNLESRDYFQFFSTSTAYYKLYKIWGYLLRPSDFDEQVRKRYGLTKAPFNNPYPYPWENPKWTNGGSGQLPLGLVQVKDDNGQYTGMIASSCSGCHDSKIGGDGESYFHWGRANGSIDAGLIQSDLFRANVFTEPLQLAPIPWSVNRGNTDAIGIIDYLPALFDMDTMMLAPSLLEYFPSHAGGQSKAPHWYHRAFKTRQFWDGALTSDNVRSEAAFGMANLTRDAEARRALTPEFEDIDNFLISMSPPTYPGEIDFELAEEGAIIFHERDLWAGGANADIPKTPGNGSCASCHGVYSPRHAADTNYLPDPRLKGVSGVITPLETIGTDPQRALLMEDERKRRAWNTSFFAYNDLSPDHTGFVDSLIVSELNRVPRSQYDRGEGPVFSPLGPNEWIDPFGYIAPPLYGVWGGAPYFHNGSVPDMWGVLKPSSRARIWKRNQTAPGDFGKNRGLDMSFAAFDWEKMGWKHEALECSNNFLTSPFLPCTNDMATPDILFANVANKVAEFNSLAYQTPPPITDKQIKSRMIFNSYLYSMGNQGHEFTKSLTDEERYALIEYMKTL